MSNNLYDGLLQINKKYESTTFIDIDIIQLFNLDSYTKKTITTKYYNLALIYHPDKYTKKEKYKTIKINDIDIDINDIKTGLFLSFITDIYKLLTNNLDDIVLLKGGVHTMNNNGDHSKLKQSYTKNTNPHDSPNGFVNEKIIEIKLNKGDINKLIETEHEKRHKLKIENIFTDTEEKSDKFDIIFNDKFEVSVPNVETTTEIIAYNELNSHHKLISNKNISISNIEEAFEPLKINRKLIRETLTYEQYINKRETDIKSHCI